MRDDDELVKFMILKSDACDLMNFIFAIVFRRSEFFSALQTVAVWRCIA